MSPPPWNTGGCPPPAAPLPKLFPMGNKGSLRHEQLDSVPVHPRGGGVSWVGGRGALSTQLGGMVHSPAQGPKVEIFTDLCACYGHPGVGGHCSWSWAHAEGIFTFFLPASAPRRTKHFSPKMDISAPKKEKRRIFLQT